MRLDPKKRAQVLDRIRELGGLREGVATTVARETGVAEADVYGAGSFYHLLANPDTRVRVCTGLSCAMAGAHELLNAAQKAGLPTEECSCLAACDRPPAVLRERDTLVEVSIDDVHRAGGDWTQLESSACPQLDWVGAVGPADVDAEGLAINLLGEPGYDAAAFRSAVNRGADDVIAALDESGLQGRGGAGFPAAIKWRAVRGQAETERYVVLNADEGEPGTFKDRETMLRRPDLVIEGLAIAAHVLGARDVYMYLRGEFGAAWRAMEAAVERFADAFDGVRFHFHPGHGAYICGEETALLEALEGKRGMPRLKPPFPGEVGLWGKPTLVQNVETIACVPSILQRGGRWFRELGKTEPGTKLYNVSGDVERPGTYELPLGVSLDELAAAAGGYRGTLRAFSPGGASSGFLPASKRDVPLSFKGLAAEGSMLGSAGVVVLNDTRDLTAAVREQLVFFERESCGQCAPCRIGTRFVREALDGYQQARGAGRNGASRSKLAQVADVAWEMNEGSICGLGQAAPLALTSAMEHFPSEFSGGKDHE